MLVKFCWPTGPDKAKSSEVKSASNEIEFVINQCGIAAAAVEKLRQKLKLQQLVVVVATVEMLVFMLKEVKHVKRFVLF